MRRTADIPIPSTESDSPDDASSDGSSSDRLRTPSVTPSEQRRRQGSSQDALTSGLRNVHITEPAREQSGTPRQRRNGRRSSAGIDRSPHSVLDEELPGDAFHTPEFQGAFQDAKNLMTRVKGVLGSSALHRDPQSTMRRLHQEAGELAGFEYPSTRTVGFVGDSGVGESRNQTFFCMQTHIRRQEQSSQLSA